MASTFSPRYWIAFLSLSCLMMELHEQAHINTGLAICGCYGFRNAYTWATADSCAHSHWSILATVAGPLFSYTGIWLGAWWMTKSRSLQLKAFGFVFLFAHLPFARIFTALMGGGDEKTVLLHLLPSTVPQPVVKVIAVLFVIAICLPPMVIAFRQLAPSQRWKLILSMNLVPLLFSFLYTHLFLNTLLSKGILSATFFDGTPLLIQLSFGLMLIAFLLFCKGFFEAKSWLKTTVVKKGPAVVMKWQPG